MRAVGALAPARLEQPSLVRHVQHAGEQALSRIPGQQPGAELAKHSVVKTGIGQVQGQQIPPVDPGPDRPPPAEVETRAAKCSRL